MEGVYLYLSIKRETNLVKRETGGQYFSTGPSVPCPVRCSLPCPSSLQETSFRLTAGKERKGKYV